MSKFKDHTGDVNYNTQGLKMTVIAYRGVRSIDVMFEDGYVIKNCCYSNFKAGKLNSYYYPTVCEKGYLGDIPKSEKVRDLDSYKSWVYMIKRCYGENVESAYMNCSVCDEWLCYSNYKIWFDENYYTVGDITMNLDKDILIKGNKIYSPNTCVFTPQNINKLFTKSNRTRGELPIGVYKVNGCDNKYAAHFNSCGKLVNLGTFNTIEGAFNAYKEAKEKEIKRVADEYKGKIPQKLYDAMYRYQVEITD